MVGSAVVASTSWLVLAALYVLFAGAVSSTEIIAGIPATVLATLFVLQLRRTQSRRLWIRPPWFRILGSPLAAVFPDAVKVGRVLWRAVLRRPPGPVGVISRQGFHEGDDSAEDAGRRGLVTLGLSLAPNGYVLNILAGEDALLLHRLVSEPASPDKEWPV